MLKGHEQSGEELQIDVLEKTLKAQEKIFFPACEIEKCLEYRPLSTGSRVESIIRERSSISFGQSLFRSLGRNRV